MKVKRRGFKKSNVRRRGMVRDIQIAMSLHEAEELLDSLLDIEELSAVETRLVEGLETAIYGDL